MAIPQSGKWLGVFVTQDGKAVQLNLQLEFGDDGSAGGSFEVYPIGNTQWTGPQRGTFSRGGYSPFGTLHLAEEADSGRCGEATFDGQYEVHEPHSAVISGTVLIRRQDQVERGTLSAVFAEKQKTAVGHVWGN
ncbi:MAG: hypothetical protein JOY54_02585 [Acidobacteriaceae bacterium]|nr:hypothetical protein [Acidobacteriaceae bacterium]